MTTPTPAPIYLDDGQPPIEPYEFGLLSVARVLTGNGQWQIGGVQYDTDNCAEGGYVVGWCPTPTNPQDQTATVTLAASGTPATTAWNAAPDADSPESVTLTNTGNQPVTVRVLRTGGPPEVDAFRDYDDPTAMTVKLDIDNSISDPAVLVPVAAGATQALVLEPGDYTLSDGTGCTVTFSLPHDGSTDPFGSCTSQVSSATVTNAAVSQYAMRYAVLDADGTVVSAGVLAPGAVAPVAALPDGAYTLELTGSDGRGPTPPVTQAFTMPLAAPLTVPVPRTVPTGTSHDKPKFQGLNQVNGCGPFTVYHRAECNSVGWANQDVSAIARRRLELVEDQWAEEGFWDLCLYGRIDQAVKPLGEEPVDFKQGLGGLQQAAARYYNGKPTFHVPRWVFPYFQQQDQVRIVGDVQRTYLNEKVAFGAGYWNSSSPGPGGAFWIFATGAVTARRSEPLIHEPVLDIPTNTYTVLAERTYAFDTDCLLMAVLLTVDGMG